MYKVVFRPRALKRLEALHLKDREKIVQKIRLLQKEPFSSRLDVKRLRGTKRSWRIRAGDVRAIYEIDKDQKEIFVRDVGYRGSIY